MRAHEILIDTNVYGRGHGHIRLWRPWRPGVGPAGGATPEEASVAVRIAGDWDLSATGPVEVSGSEISGSFPLVRDERIATQRR